MISLAKLSRCQQPVDRTSFFCLTAVAFACRLHHSPDHLPNRTGWSVTPEHVRPLPTSWGLSTAVSATNNPIVEKPRPGQLGAGRTSTMKFHFAVGAWTIGELAQHMVKNVENVADAMASQAIVGSHPQMRVGTEPSPQPDRPCDVRNQAARFGEMDAY